MKPLLAASLLLVGCTDDTSNPDSGVLLRGPALSHAVPDGPFVAGDTIPITVTATDDDGVDGVDLVYRTTEGDYWETLALTGETGSELWVGEVAEGDVSAPGLDYYFRAVDTTGATTFLPLDNAASPYLIEVADKGTPLPFTEDFEDSTAGYGPLYSLGWASVADGFAGYPFEISEAQAYDGVAGLLHPRGYEGVSLLDDWLLAPALDFEGVDAIQVTWWEQGRSTPGADHSLWISTTDRDPRNGTHVQVAILADPSEDGWGRSEVIDLSEWAGEPIVHLAWHYVGSYVDDWYLDAVSVRDMTCDPVLTADWATSPVLPGETVDLSVDVVNGLEVACAGLTATVSFPEGGASVDSPELALGDLDALGVLSGTSAVVVDGDWPQHSYLPLLVTLTDGVDTWTLEQDLVVGQTSELRMALDVSTEGVVQIRVGVGDPEDPEWSFDLLAETLEAGLHTVTADVTDQHDLLPPGPGEDRWFAEIDATGSGSVTALEIDFGDTTYSATVGPSWWGDENVFAWLPEPPVPVLTLGNTVPSTVTPGDNVELSLTLRNQGADTAGPVTVELSSVDGDLTLLSGGPAALTLGVWAANTSASTASPFRLLVSADHVDSTELNLSLDVTDGVESWTLPVTVAVPWVVVKATSILIDDSSGGNGDGLLDAGETAILEIELTNVGDLNADGYVETLLVVEETSTAGLTLDVADDTLSSLASDSSRTAEFTVTVDSIASPGDTLDLRVDSTDDRSTYRTPTSLILGEAPWLSVSSVDDDRGDAYGYTFDLVNVLYRVEGDTMEMMFQAAEPYDVSTAFVEMWAVATGGDYTWYRMAMQSGKASLQGYDSGFVDLGEPTVTVVSSTELLISWPLADMDEDASSMRAGFGSGWCATDTESFCDHFPDGWGYYYHSTYTDSRFFTLRW